MNGWYQIPNISETQYVWDPIFLRPDISETRYFWDPIFLRPDISETRNFWDPIFLKPDISETLYFWDPIFLMPDISVYLRLFLKFLWLFIGYFENIKFTLGAEVLSTFCSCLSYRLQYLNGSSYGLSRQITQNKFCN